MPRIFVTVIRRRSDPYTGTIWSRRMTAWLMRVQVEIILLGREIVEHEDSRIVEQEIALQRQDLAPIAQGTLGQQPDLGERIEHHPAGLTRSISASAMRTVSPSSRSDA